MTDIIALKNRIRAAIKANDNQEITGPMLQQALLDMVDELNGATETEASRRQNGDSTLQQSITAEKNRAEGVEQSLSQADTTLNNLITGIKNNIDNGYVYAGIAMPSTTPVSGKVFYVAVQAGTYTNFGGAAVTEGITILKYNGASWVKEQALFIDGDVFDISAYRATGGTLATYADLTAALGTNGENIPQSLRKGGMSVKFVQTSDNKYVQYRLMATSWSTTVSDWQNIGLAQQIGLSETVAMSQKAVTDELNKIDSKVDNIKADARIRMTEIHWSALKALRDNGKLVAGHQYRITDYQCTTVQEDTKSAGHQFDIIVTADSNNKLNEVARAIQHDGDTYFSKSKLEAWKIWYRLDNDTTHFAWADATNGKGVIYRMIDEWNNDCPYDFKNIQFKRYKITKADSIGLVGKYLGFDESRNPASINVDKNDSKMFYTFSYLGKFQELNEYEGKVLEDASIIGNTLASDVNSPYGVLNNSIKRVINVTSDGSDIIDIESTETIQILNNIVFLTNIGDDEFYYGCRYNFFENDCCYNSFNNECYLNSFGSNCSSNIFGSDCCYNIFGSNCSSNIFGSDCYYNIFGSNCSSNIFGSDCYYNKLGSDCHHNIFGSNCRYNIFGSNCSSNIFGSDCCHNKLGVNSSNNKLDAYYENNKFENGVQYVEFSGVGTNTAKVQNYHIKQGMIFASNAKHTITAKPGLNYELTVAKQSDGTVVEYCEADLLKAIARTSVTDSAKKLD